LTATEQFNLLTAISILQPALRRFLPDHPDIKVEIIVILIRCSADGDAHRCLFLVGLLAGALSAGFFYTYSISVMPGLAAADPLSGIRAMQGINAVIRTPVLAFAFFWCAFPSSCCCRCKLA
jgi:hypothetical protein